jgi:hypothetical protein
MPDAFAFEDGLPRPRWDRIEAWATAHEPAARRDAWVAAVRHWLAALGDALGGGYGVVESGRFLVFAPESHGYCDQLLRCAGRCRIVLTSLLGDVAAFDDARKELIVALRSRSEYYSYICFYDPDGEHGESGGVHIREGHAHVALHGIHMQERERVLAHELTHVALHHLRMPQWIEEGLAQLAERSVTGREPLDVDEALALAHKRHWSEHGLEPFWRGDGFSAPDRLQQRCYELAGILVRLLVEDARPRWFGGEERRARFLGFLRAARDADGGEAAAREHLGIGLGDLAGRFLGPRGGGRAA